MLNLFGEYYYLEDFPNSTSRKTLKSYGLTGFRSLWDFFGMEQGDSIMEFLTPLMELCVFEKGHIFNEKDEIWYDAYYIIKGTVLVYQFTDANNAVAALNDGNMIGSPESHLKIETASQFQFQTASRVFALRISPEARLKILGTDVDELFTVFIMKYASKIVSFLTSLISTLSYDSQKRAELYRERFPGLAEGIPAKITARVLHMQPETFSRVLTKD